MASQGERPTTSGIILFVQGVSCGLAALFYLGLGKILSAEVIYAFAYFLMTVGNTLTGPNQLIDKLPMDAWVVAIGVSISACASGLLQVPAL